MSNLDNQTFAALVDSFGSMAISDAVRYWTVDDRNTRVITLSGLVLANRVLWLAISMGVLGLSYWRFSFAERKTSRHARPTEEASVRATRKIPKVGYQHGLGARFQQVASQVRVDFFETIKSNVFIVLSLVTLINVSVSLLFSDPVGFGLSALPVTYNMIDLIRGSMYAFLLGIIAFYTGVMVWKEREAKLDEVFDALPQATWTIFLGKFIAMTLIVMIILTIGIFAGVAVQASEGYTRFQLGLYVTEILGLDLLNLLMLVLLSMAAHIVAPNKYLGYFLFVILVVCNAFIWSALEVSTRLVRYGSLPEYTYSDMFGFAPFVNGLLPFAIYWLLFSVLLGIACIRVWQRGKERTVKKRVSFAIRLFRGPIAVTSGCVFALWIAAGSWIYYNTIIRNELLAASEVELRQASYEKDFKVIHEGMSQPNVISVKYNIDIFPERRAIEFAGDQKIINRSKEPIELLLLNFADGYETEVEVENATLKEAHEDQDYYIYEVNPAMQPGVRTGNEIHRFLRTEGV